MQSDAQPSAGNAVWIDTSTKQSVQLLADEVTLLVAVLYNTPTVGCYHVQKHVQSRCPKIIEEGRVLGQKLDRVYKGLAKDTQFAVESLGSQVLASHDVFKSIETSTNSWIERFIQADKEIKARQKSAPAQPAARSEPSTAVTAVAAVEPGSAAASAPEREAATPEAEASPGQEGLPSGEHQAAMVDADMDDDDVHAAGPQDGADGLQA